MLDRLEQRRGTQNDAQRKATHLYGKLNVQTVEEVIRVIRFTASIGGLVEDDYDNDDWQGLDAKRFTALCTDRNIHTNNMVVQAANFTTLWDMFTPAPAESIKSIVSGSSTLSHGSQGNHPQKAQSKSVRYKETFLTSTNGKHHCGHDLKGKSLWDVLPEVVKDYFFWNGEFRRLSHLKNITAIKTLMLEQKEKTSLATIEELVAQHIGSF